MVCSRVIINKTDPRSRILGETYAVAVEPNAAFEYASLIRKTWPGTELKIKHNS